MFIKLYAIALPVFFAIDMVWLGLVAKDFYRAQIGMLMKSDVNWTAAIVFYLIFITGLVVFVIAFMVVWFLTAAVELSPPPGRRA